MYGDVLPCDRLFPSNRLISAETWFSACFSTNYHCQDYLCYSSCQLDFVFFYQDKDSLYGANMETTNGLCLTGQFCNFYDTEVVDSSK